jgi:uncharacterized protein YbcC (UPF0753/DUF2309 family)
MDRDLSLGERLKIRAMVYVASEPIARFWPMRTFIHHNPLFGLEHRPFPEAVAEGTSLFHARGYLTRQQYQEYRRAGRVDDEALARRIGAFAAAHDPGVPGVDLERWLWCLAVDADLAQLCPPADWLDGAALAAALRGRRPEVAEEERHARLLAILERRLPPDAPFHERVDALFGTGIGPAVDELVIKACLDFFDEGQSVWGVPGRERGFFPAWRDVARRDLRLLIHGRASGRLLAEEADPEAVVASILADLGIPEEHWQATILRELTHLHGWAGFVRFRQQAPGYYWAARFPADLVDFLAVRLVVERILVLEAARRHRSPADAQALAELVAADPAGAYLRTELHGGTVLPGWAQRVEQALARRRPAAWQRLAARYIEAKAHHEAAEQAGALRRLAEQVGGGAPTVLQELGPHELDRLLGALRAWEREEGYAFLLAMESRVINDLIRRVRVPETGTPTRPTRRPFAQAFFCIDVRSEPLRRHLEALGDYETFGIAGFFGVPMAFLEYGNGSEQPLCPAIMTPKNLVAEIPAGLRLEEEPLFGALSEVFHGLKQSVMAPFVAVEAVGLLFGLGLVGRTLWPVGYHRLRDRFHGGKPPTRLLVDKLSADQADSIVRAVQRAMIVQALARELRVARDQVTDDEVRELREIALGNAEGPSALATRLGLSEAAEARFVETLRSVYRVERREAARQLERLGRLGFSLEEQVQFVARALTSTGLTSNFSRFVLIIGHESLSRNNPYESALDCGAAGGAHGLPNARAFCAMANKPEVRLRLRELGIVVPEDTWFVPGSHTTTTDEVTLADLDQLPSRHLLYLERLQAGLAAAARRCAAERVRTLGLGSRAERSPQAAAQAARRQANDWSQVRPEWGLSRNLYGIVGGRHLTEGVDLGGRAFLLSYDHRFDPDGRFLENLLSAPVVVGEWINLEHYFSTVDPHRFGSGSKVYHNVAGRFGVMTGNQSDLRTGLPLQTLYKDRRPYHEPMRLVALVEAPVRLVLAVVQRLPKVRSLVFGEWIRVVVLDPEDGYRVLVLEDGRLVDHLDPTSEPCTPTVLEEAR